MTLEQKFGYRLSDNIMDNDIFESQEEIIYQIEEVIFYECPECGERFEDEEEAEDCCKEENEDEDFEG